MQCDLSPTLITLLRTSCTCTQVDYATHRKKFLDQAVLAAIFTVGVLLSVAALMLAPKISVDTEHDVLPVPLMSWDVPSAAKGLDQVRGESRQTEINIMYLMETNKACCCVSDVLN